MNSAGLNLIKEFEGLRLSPYLDASGKPTIGYGNTFYADGTPVKLTDKPITQAQASSLFNKIVSNFERELLKLVTVSLNENQKSALVSLAYNIGIGAFKSSTLLKKLNVNPNDTDIENQFNRWIYSNSKVLNGLVRRRKAEWDLYNKPVVISKKFLLSLLLFFLSVLAITL